MKRPSCLAQVASWSDSFRGFGGHLTDFLEQFYLERRPQMLEEPPRRLAPVFPEGEVADAYLAATAASLAQLLDVDPPPWAFEESRKLKRPWFASRSASLRAILIAESPAAFRERNLFVSENALSRA
jgi:hypothetical protein